jgi:AraC-like DNA-binding protein
MTQTNRTCAACLQLQQRAEAEAITGPKTLQCYAGLSETAVPVRVGHQVLGYIQTGQVFLRAPSRKSFQAIAPLLPPVGAGGDTRGFEAAYFQTRVVTKKHYESVLRLLAVFAEHLATISNQMLLMALTAESPMVAKVRAYVAARQREALCLDEVAHEVNMSAAYFSKVFRRTTGLTFTEYLARERTESAKQMLLNFNARVSEVAYAAGFQSLSQFNRVFHRIAGETPTCYRDRLRGLNGPPARPTVLIPAVRLVASLRPHTDNTPYRSPARRRMLAQIQAPA